MAHITFPHFQTAGGKQSLLLLNWQKIGVTRTTAVQAYLSDSTITTFAEPSQSKTQSPSPYDNLGTG